MFPLRALALTLVLLLLVPVGSSQGPAINLVLDGGPASEVLSRRGVAIVSFNATLRMSGVVCSSASDFVVQVVGASQQEAAEDENTSLGNASVNVTPGELRFPVAAGPYGNNPGLPAAQPYEERQTIAVSVESAGLPNETTYAVDLDATLQSGSTSACRGTNTLPSASAHATFRVTFNETQAPLPTSPEMPLSWWGAPLGLVAAALVGLRRRA